MLIITNFKTYPSALGENALKLAGLHAQISQEKNAELGVAPSAVDLHAICKTYPHLTVFAQHCDDAGFGSFTGKISPEYLKSIGVKGTLLNHSEYRLPKEQIVKNCQRAKGAGLKVIICAENDEEGAELMQLCSPDFIAVEPPELIGGDISVSTAQPKLISHAVEKIGKGSVIVGAGVKNSDDVRIAKELGASGILLASGVTKAENPQRVLEDLVSGTQ
ncbi:triose-phosphate isomerase [Candidatus Peregrinibacteria bacterium]|jgi:triosephosphate isomerase (TIM)|nr:triose-phosphate isomerase [Candidatus Peregrinibacteria bacterium]